MSPHQPLPPPTPPPTIPPPSPPDEKKKESISRKPKDVNVKLFVHGLVPGRFEEDTVLCGCGGDGCASDVEDMF